MLFGERVWLNLKMSKIDHQLSIEFVIPDLNI